MFYLNIDEQNVMKSNKNQQLILVIQPVGP